MFKRNNSRKLLPAEVFVHFILIPHPCVSVHKEFQEGKDSHESECYERHYRDRIKVSIAELQSVDAERNDESSYLSHRLPKTPRSSRELWGRRPTPSPESEPSSW